MKKKKTRTPLIRRIPRELAGDWKKYLLVSLFLILTIGFVSGMYVANESMMKAADEGVTKYKLEDGHFELNEEADQTLLAAIATGEKADVKQYYTDKAKRELDEKFDDEFEDKFKDEFDSQFKEEFDRKFNAEFQTQFDQTFAAQVKQTLLAQGMDETMAAAMLDTAVAQAKQAGSYQQAYDAAYGSAYQKAYDTAYDEAYGKAHDEAYEKAYDEAWDKILDEIDEKYQKAEDKYELNKAFYAMMKSEKLAVFMILLFILLIASFNIIGSISMLILDKKEDLGTYKALGMTNQRIISVFKTEGNLITMAGAVIGLVFGTLICLLQEKYGLITLGDGSYIITAYPVKIVFEDILLIVLAVLSIGYTASYFPVKYLVNKLAK